MSTIAEEIEYLQAPYVDVFPESGAGRHHELCPNPLMVLSYFWHLLCNQPVCYHRHAGGLPLTLPNFMKLVCIGTLLIGALKARFLENKLFSEAPRHLSLVRFEQVCRFFHILDPRQSYGSISWTYLKNTTEANQTRLQKFLPHATVVYVYLLRQAFA